MTAASGYVVDVGRRQVLIGGGMLLTAIASRFVMPRPGPPMLGPAGLEPLIPNQFARWRSSEVGGFVLPPQDETEKKVYDEILTRTYVADGDAPIMLLLAFGGGQTGTLEIHRPEACYPAQGYRLSGRQEIDLLIGRTPIPAVVCTAANNSRIEQLLYWTRIGDAFPRSWGEEQIATVRSNLAGLLPDGILVRISTISVDAEGSRERLKQFAAALADATSGIAHKIIFAKG